jgi:hypothetical protein
VRRVVSCLLLVPLVGGCAVSKDGVGFESQHAVRGGVLIVGTTGPLRTLSGAERDEFYRGYVAAALRPHAGESARGEASLGASSPGASSPGEASPGESPVLTAAQFSEKIAGWASIQTFSVPLVMNLRYRVLVPMAVARDTRFTSAAASFVFGASGDLVAARSDRDGLLWIDRVLCKAGRSYEACAQKYALGVFDESTGRELGRDSKPKRDGEWVDISSYLRLSNDPEHHSASELDVRAINRCDDCKGSLPGSVQSSVSLPPP